MNPWKDLPLRPPYIAPIDVNVLAAGSFKKDHYRFDAYPDPYVGNVHTSKVVFLSLNPGFKPEDITVNLSNKTFLSESKKSLLHQRDATFFYWLPELRDSFGYAWWSKYLAKTIREENVSHESLQKNMMQIEYMPYHSETYKPNNIILPSQLYSFDMVKDAVRSNKIIVMMRSEKLWIKAVPELKNYSYIRLNNTERPWISRGNMTKHNKPEVFDKLVSALKA